MNRKQEIVDRHRFGCQSRVRGGKETCNARQDEDDAFDSKSIARFKPSFIALVIRLKLLVSTFSIATTNCTAVEIIQYLLMGMVMGMVMAIVTTMVMMMEIVMVVVMAKIMAMVMAMAKVMAMAIRVIHQRGYEPRRSQRHYS